MPFCPSCRCEFRPDFDTCVDCGERLVATLSVESPPEETAPARRIVFTTTSLSESESVRLLMESRGIEAAIENEEAAFLAIGMPISAVPLAIVVPADREADARRILAERPRATLSVRPSFTPWLVAIVGILLGLQIRWHGQEPPAAFLASLFWLVLLAFLLLRLRDLPASHRVAIPRIAGFFLWGAIGCHAIIFLGDWALQNARENPGLPAWLVAGPIEEFLKALLPLVIVARSSSLRSHRIEWIVGCAAAGAGFGVTENLLMFVTAPSYESVSSLIFLRIVCPLHFAFSLFIGNEAGRRAPDVRAGLLSMLLVWLVVSILHSGWNALVVYELWIPAACLWLGVLLYLVTTWRALARELRREGAVASPPATPAV